MIYLGKIDKFNLRGSIKLESECFKIERGKFINAFDLDEAVKVTN